ncbi:MAG: beta-aspartyl-peptidase [Gammaproteobacteria bacterium]|nr:beta-aspartyl-peptidase [Gammaproteobacteria bacterium]
MLHLIRNAHIHSPKDIGPGHILIADERIAYIGSKEPELDKALLATDVDLAGQRLAPGLIDAHTHTTGGGGEAGFATRVPAVPLSEFTSAGVTSVVGLLGTDDTVRSTSSLIAQTYALREEGLNAWCYTGGYHYPLTTLTGSVRSDIIHIECVIGVGELAISDHRSSQPQFDEIIRVASDAHVAGLMTGKAGIVHFHLGDGERGLSLIERAIKETELPARIFNPTHVNRQKELFEEACALTSSGCCIDITAFPRDDSGSSWTASEAWQHYRERNCPADKITISSDGGGCLPTFNKDGEIDGLDFARSKAMSDCLQELLSLDHQLEDILPAMTSNPANLLKLAGKGQITKGSDADFFVLDDENNISDVMVRGTWHIRNREILKRGQFESN